jgi:hypothetical protein
MNASELIRDSLQDIGLVAAENPIDGEETVSAIRYLNRLMAAKVHLGLGYTEVVSGGDDITTPEYSWEWMQKALAIRMAPRFGQLDSYAFLKADEKEAYSTVLLATQQIGPPQLSGNVPLGSGNGYLSNCSNSFYTETDDGVLSETNQQIVVEDDT